MFFNTFPDLKAGVFCCGISISSPVRGSRPVLATRVTGCKETYVEGETGLGFNVKDVDDLVRTLETFIEMPYEEKVEMGKKGRKFVEDNYDRNIVIEAYYDKIFDRNSK